jgi:hypothetical protein
LRRQWYVVHREKQRLTRAAVAFKAFLLTSAEALLAPAQAPRSATAGKGGKPAHPGRR